MTPDAPVNLEILILPSPDEPERFLWEVAEEGKGRLEASTDTYATEAEAQKAAEAALEALKDGGYSG